MDTLLSNSVGIFKFAEHIWVLCQSISAHLFTINTFTLKLHIEFTVALFIKCAEQNVSQRIQKSLTSYCIHSVRCSLPTILLKKKDKITTSFIEFLYQMYSFLFSILAIENTQASDKPKYDCDTCSTLSSMHCWIIDTVVEITDMIQIKIFSYDT